MVGMRILIADDNATMRSMLEKNIEKVGSSLFHVGSLSSSFPATR